LAILVIGLALSAAGINADLVWLPTIGAIYRLLDEHFPPWKNLTQGRIENARNNMASLRPHRDFRNGSKPFFRLYISIINKPGKKVDRSIESPIFMIETKLNGRFA
jgi:hypothetical protein